MTFRQGVAIGIGLGVVLTLFGEWWLISLPYGALPRLVDWLVFWR